VLFREVESNIERSKRVACIWEKIKRKTTRERERERERESKRLKQKSVIQRKREREEGFVQERKRK